MASQKALQSCLTKNGARFRAINPSKKCSFTKQLWGWHNSRKPFLSHLQHNCLVCIQIPFVVTVTGAFICAIASQTKCKVASILHVKRRRLPFKRFILPSILKTHYFTTASLLVSAWTFVALKQMSANKLNILSTAQLVSKWIQFSERPVHCTGAPQDEGTLS